MLWRQGDRSELFRVEIGKKIGHELVSERKGAEL